MGKNPHTILDDTQIDPATTSSGWEKSTPIRWWHIKVIGFAVAVVLFSFLIAIIAILKHKGLI